MGKRSNFERAEKDFYPTPKEAFLPLLPYLVEYGKNFIEPCCGDGRLVRYLEEAGYTCVQSSDDEVDARYSTYPKCDFFITNPPWTRSTLHGIIENLSTQAWTWLLFDADWMHTKQSAGLIKRCSTILPIGRVKWIEGSKHTGKDNVCWYLFIPGYFQGPKFLGR